jgi:methionyl aminopeptidase
MQHIQLKNKVAIDKMRTAGKKLAQILLTVESEIKEGISTHELDFLIEKLMREQGLKPVCKGYGTYRHATCISVNDVVVHGVPTKDTILKSGDFVKIDVVGSFESYCADMARYFFVGDVSERVLKLASVAQSALDKAIRLIKPGVFLSDISACIQNEVEAAGFGVVRYFSGHGIGKSLHEAPDVPNYGKPGTGPVLREGMTLAIEPMITEGSYEIVIMSDGWTAKTQDGGLAAHVEDTIVVTRDGVEILTRL